MFLVVVSLAGCGTSTLSEAPYVSSLRACAVSRDAVRSAANVVYTTTGSYPTTFTAMTRSNPPVLTGGINTTVSANAMEGKGWKLTLSGGGTTPPKLICANAPLG